MHTILQPEGWAKPIGYANGVAARGRLVFVGGQVGWNGQCQFETDDFVGQVRQTLANIVAVVAEAGGEPQHITSMTWYFTDKADAHARTLEAHNLTKHRLNACGYSLGARFTPSWMDMPMFYQGNPEPIAPNMTLFAHMIIMDSETETAMTLGRTYLTTESAPKPLSRHDLDLIVQ